MSEKRFSNDLDGASSSKKFKSTKHFNLAIAGCSHGEMDKIYGTLANLERNHNFKFDLLICCGDFQAIRNKADLAHLHVPSKYSRLMTFYKYYSGEKIAPILTIFVGGNHESSGFMQELPYGGWVAPNIYYMGYASVINCGPLRIAGLSGIYKPRDYHRGHFEKPPFNGSDIVTAYHVRSVDIFRLKQLRNRDDDITTKTLDAVVTHDWPSGITSFGNVNWLINIKPHFEEDIKNGELGNPVTMDLLRELQPRRWFSAHLHVNFEAEVIHTNNESDLTKQKTTKFLSLDKPLPRRKYIEYLEVPLEDEVGDEPFDLSYDSTWLAILKNTDFLTEITNKNVYMPGKTSSGERYDFRPTKKEIEEINNIFNNNFKIPLNFRRTAPPEQSPEGRGRISPSKYYRNPQTMEFCEKLGIKDLNLMFCQSGADYATPYYLQEEQSSMVGENAKNNEEIDIEDVDVEDGEEFGNDLFIIDTQPSN